MHVGHIPVASVFVTLVANNNYCGMRDYVYVISICQVIKL